MALGVVRHRREDLVNPKGLDGGPNNHVLQCPALWIAHPRPRGAHTCSHKPKRNVAQHVLSGQLLVRSVG